jgi:hypothetical protein
MATEHPLAIRLGRRYAEDPGDKLFPMSAVMATVPTPNSKHWTLGPQLDQLQTPRCVGYSTRQHLTASPHRYKKPSPSADEIYAGAQANDEWPGTAYDGTSERGAMKYLQSLGIIASYHWAQDVEEACQFVLTTGPVMIGALWTNDMFEPVNGFVKPTGAVAGGHEFVLSGYNHKQWRCYFDNSWGLKWGVSGRFYMDRTDFEHLMANQGDMVASVEA